MKRYRWTLFLAGLLSLVLISIASAPTWAQDEEQEPAQEPIRNLPPLLLFTPYPSQVIGLGETANLDLTLRTGTEEQIVGLSLQDLPENWTATFRGGNQIVQSTYVIPGEDATVNLRVEPPAEVEPGQYAFTVVAEGDGTQAELPIELTIQERVPASLAFEVDLPTIRNRPDSMFSYNATLRNDGGEDLTVDLAAEAPQGFVVTFRSGGQEVTSLPVAAGASERLTVEAEPLTDVAVGTYPIAVHAHSGDVEASLDLTAEVVGQSTLVLTTPDGRLSGEAEAGVATTYPLLLQNTGSAPSRNITLNNTAPNGWEVTFEPAEIAEIPPGQQQEVTVHVTPPDKTIAGDYVVNFSARPEGASSESIEYRVTVRTSTLWGVAGVGLIAVAVAVVGLAVARFGRR